MRRLAALLVILGSVLGTMLTTAAPAAHAASAAPSVALQPAARITTAAPAITVRTLGDRVLDKAETKTGHWYSWGGSGPTYFDCSGLVNFAARQVGIVLPRTTYGLLADTRHFYRIPVSSARRGDLLFYGTGHVEFATIWYHTSFGAAHSGTRISWHRWSSYWQPTIALRFR